MSATANDLAIRGWRWAGRHSLAALLLIIGGTALGQEPSATPTPTPETPYGFAAAVATATPTATATRTATIPSCASEYLQIDPVTSPTNLLTQTVTGCRHKVLGAPNSCVTMTVSSEAGSYPATSGGTCETNGIAFSANVGLAPDQANHLEVCATPCGCPVTLCETFDRNSQLLTIVQNSSVDQRIGGKMLMVKDKDGIPSKRKVVVLSKDLGIAPPLAGGGDDPRLAGAQLRLVNLTATETATFPLPASGWTGLGNPPGEKGYQYLDAGLVNGPCKKVIFKPAAKLKAVCLGSQIGFALDDPSAPDLAVVLETGSTRHCMEFGGQLLKYRAAIGGAGIFKAQDALAPASCAP